MNPDRWRLGTRNPYTVYRVADGARDVDHAREHFVCAFRREEDAATAVDAVNAWAARWAAPLSLHELTSAAEAAFECADITVDVREADGTVSPLRRLVRCLRSAGLLDERRDRDGDEWADPADGEDDQLGPACDEQPADTQRAAPTRDVEAVIEAFARHRHEATGRDMHNGRNVRPDGDARGASPIGLCTWAEAPEDWREGYRELCRRDADVARAALRADSRDDLAEQAYAELSAIEEAVRAAGHEVSEVGPLRAVRAVEAALRSAGADGGGEDDVRAWAQSHGVGDGDGDGQPHLLVEIVEKVRLTARLSGVTHGQEVARTNGQDYTSPDGRRWVTVEADPQTGEPLDAEHRRHEASVASHAYRDVVARLARAAGVDPDAADPVGEIERVIRERRDTEIVTTVEQLRALPPESVVKLRGRNVAIRCSEDGNDAVIWSVTGSGGTWTSSTLTLPAAVLYRAPAPAPAPLAVGEVVTGQRAVDAPVGTKLGAQNAAVAAVRTTGGWSVTGMGREQDHEHAVRINEWVVLALGGGS